MRVCFLIVGLASFLPVYDHHARAEALRPPYLEKSTTVGNSSKGVPGGEACHIPISSEIQGDVLAGPIAPVFVAQKDGVKRDMIGQKNSLQNMVLTENAGDRTGSEDVKISRESGNEEPELWKNPTPLVEDRVKDLIRRMSLDEKVAQMCNEAPAIPRLGLPAYNYWNECLHGVARAGVATVFPQAIGMAATWDVPLVHEEADAIATEARAKHNDYTLKHNGDSARYYGLTFWTPNINIFRDPRWGRGQETYGEDPFLTARLAVAFIRGLQGDDPKYIKAMACAKHFAVHSGPELERHRFDAEPSQRDLYETYLPQFEAVVHEGHVGGVMGAYNSVYGRPACANPLLLTELLRNQWGFDGYVTSDCGAIYDIYANHKMVATSEEAAALAVKAGCDLCCGGDYDSLAGAVHKGLISEKEVNEALAHVLATRFRLGLFDPPNLVPYTQITLSENDSLAHAELALRVARESMVLLKNDGLLPLNRRRIKRIAVIGANADSVPVLLGNYNGDASHPITILDGIKHVVGNEVDVVYQPGCPLAIKREGKDPLDRDAVEKAISAAKLADVVVYVGGLSPQLEGESMQVDYEGFAGGDRTRIELPAVQTDLLKALKATGKPTVLVNCSGSAVAMPWAVKHLDAILQTWYSGEEGGRAVAQILFGDVNPAGRLPVTFYRSTSDLPAFEDYSMSQRTYRYFKGKPLFAFGHGLSYTHFKYKSVQLDRSNAGVDDTVTVTAKIVNVGKYDGDEVVQVYVRPVKSARWESLKSLCGFCRVAIPRGRTAKAIITVPIKQFRCWNTAEQQYSVEAGDYEILVGAASDDIRATRRLRITR